MTDILDNGRAQQPDYLVDAAEAQIDALIMLAQGQRILDIAQGQHCSYNTAKANVGKLLIDLQARSKEHLVRRGHELGLLNDIPIASKIEVGLEEEWLTPQEERILSLASKGFSYAEIGAKLRFSPKCANVHMAHVTKKLGTRTLAHNVHAATQLELIEVVVDRDLVNDWKQLDR